MISIRKEIPAFADFNNRELIYTDNPYLFIFSRFNLSRPTGRVLVVCNFDVNPQYLDLSHPSIKSVVDHGKIKDLYSGDFPAMFKDKLIIPPCQFYWLVDQY